MEIWKKTLDEGEYFFHGFDKDLLYNKPKLINYQVCGIWIWNRCSEIYEKPLKEQKTEGKNE